MGTPIMHARVLRQLCRVVSFSFLLTPLLMAGAAYGAPFACTGEAIIVQDPPGGATSGAEFSTVDQTVTPVVFMPFTGETADNINNIGFRLSDGLLWGYRREGTIGVVTIDDVGTITTIGTGSLPTTSLWNSGDVSPDGSEMYFTFNGQGSVHTVDLPLLDNLVTNTITGGATPGVVADWAAHPTNGLLYGGDRDGVGSDAQIAVLDPTTGTRTDVTLVGLPGGLSGDGYGAAWFNAAGRLFLLQNSGTLFEVDLGGNPPPHPPTPSVIAVQMAPASGFNDGGACIQNRIGIAKNMTVTNTGLPATVTIVYTFENFGASSPTDDLTAVSAMDDLDFVFGMGNYMVTGISSAPTAAFANAAFNGSGDMQLINQAPTQTLAAGTTETITVTLTLTGLGGAGGSGGAGDEFCNGVTGMGLDSGGTVFGDVSTSGTDPDPNGDSNPVELGLSCFSTSDVPVELMKFSVD